MADKFMKIGGRAENTVARPLKLDLQDHLLTRNTMTRKAFGTFNLNSGTSTESVVLNSDGYSYGKLNFVVTNNVKFSLYLVTLDKPILTTEEYTELEKELIYKSHGDKSNHSVSYKLPSRYYKFVIASDQTSGGVLRAHNQELVTNENTLATTEHKKWLGISYTGLNIGTQWTSEIMQSKNKPFSKAVVNLHHPRKVKIYVKNHYYRQSNDSFLGGEFEQVYESDTAKYNHELEFETSEFYQIMVENTDTTGGTAIDQSSGELRSELPFDNKDVKQRKVKWFDRNYTDFGYDRPWVSEMASSNGLNHSKFTLNIHHERSIRISVRPYFYRQSASAYEAGDYKVVYTSKVPSKIHEAAFETPDFYNLKIEETDRNGTTINFDTYELKSNIPFVGEYKPDDNPKITYQVETKAPQDFLTFKTSPVKATDGRLTLADDGLYYVRDFTSGKITSYTDIVTGEGKVEGYYWDVATLGKVHSILSVPNKGLTVFAHKPDSVAYIYHMDTITSEPYEVYRSPEGQPNSWTFLPKSYYNGRSSMIFAGVYGGGEFNRDLVLSLDGGLTFKVVKQTNNAGGHNSHWHDVAIDVYSGMLWASEGDEIPANQMVHFSDNLGDTWHTISVAEVNQPTMIVPFHDKVVFGRDSKSPGLDVYRKVQDFSKYLTADNQITTLKEFKAFDKSAYEYFPNSVISKGAEAYTTFTTHYPNTTPQMVMATGDSGETWHTVFMANTTNADETVDKVLAIDDKNIYLIGNSSKGEIVYAERPVWK